MANSSTTGVLDRPGAPGPQPPKPQLPDVPYVANQAYRDWFGKDVQETPTVSYVWTADQFGHFGLGFQITYLLGWIASSLGYTSRRILVGLAVANLLTWVVKEVFDYLRERQKSREAKSLFKFNGKEILWNVFTALFYIAIGAVAAGAAVEKPLYGIIAVFAASPFALVLAVWWLRRKITFQQAGLPYLYRLATFPNEVDRKTAEFIVAMSKPDPAGPVPPIGKHLIISGPLESGKSSLAVGIGTEFAFRMGIGRYTTLVKLLQSVITKEGGPAHTEFNDGRILWPWETSDLLIIDDVDVISDLIPESIGDGATGRQAANLCLAALKSSIAPELLAGLKHRRTVWVLGDVPDGELARWRAMIADVIGIDPDEIKTLDLTMKVKDALRFRPAPSRAVQVKQ